MTAPRITIVTTMRNEGPYLLEWIAHHRAAGVTGFLIYSNDCDDGTDAVLDLLEAAGLVVHIRQGEITKSPQWTALKAAWTHPLVQESGWLGCIDCDEFIRLPKGIGDIPELISRQNCDAIMLRWRLFGHSGQTGIEDDLTTRRFTKAAPQDLRYPALGSYFKTLFRREGPFRQFGVHRPRQKNPDRHGLPVWSDGSDTPLPRDLVEDDNRILALGARDSDAVQLNHYSLRSAAEFLIKRDRGLPNHQKKPVDLSYWVERNFNVVDDTSIQGMEPLTLRYLQELREIPGVSDLHKQAVAWHQNRFEELMRDPAELKLFGRLVLSSGSVPPNPELSAELIQRYGVAHGT